MFSTTTRSTVFTFPFGAFVGENGLRHEDDRITVEKDGTSKLEIDVPGYSKDMITLSVEGEYLDVLLKHPKKKDVHRSYRLGYSLDSAQITATCVDGILTVTVPVKESEKPRSVPVL